MLVGIMGKMGTGKTLSMSILASYLARATKAPLYANYGLEGAETIESLNELDKLEGGILCLDELWLSMDSRMWKDNVRVSHWVNQTRKKRVIVFYTTQHIRQMEMRVRNATDILIVCEKKGQEHHLTFLDYQYRAIGKRFVIGDARRFYSLYDTFEVLKPLSWEFKKKYSGTYGHFNSRD